MSFSILKSDVSLVFDTLPDLKVRYFCAENPRDHIYTYAQMYAAPQGLAVSLRAFEQTPDEGSQVVFALGGPQSAVLRFCLSPLGAALHLLENNEAHALHLPEVTRFAGEDEHGWYWGGELLLPEQSLLEIGCLLQPESRFGVAVLKAREESGILGASYRLPPEGELLRPDLFDEAILSAF